jgi:hypothetical protein
MDVSDDLDATRCRGCARLLSSGAAIAFERAAGCSGVHRGSGVCDEVVMSWARLVA